MVTQEQIARKLGVSRQLVTFALAGYPQVSKASRERILTAARKLGYRPNPHARALRRQRTGIIALWIPDQISTHYSQVARALGRLLKQAGHELIISEVGAADANQLLSHVPVDGICAVDSSPAVQSHLESLKAKSIPVVSVGANASRKIDSVQVDLLSGTSEAMAHLIGAGFKRIAHATFVQEDDPQESRRKGYVTAMQDAGLKTEFIHYPLSEQQRPITRQLIRNYIGEHGRPEAIFCHSDDAALGIYRGLLDLGFRVPEDVALVGCDGIEDTEYLGCPLTTLVQPVPAMCVTAWQFLQQRIDQPTVKIQHSVLKPTLSLRESSRRADP
ncbi:MAG: hypothetical protein RLY20_360 [Verrucomicrobiota bacterium]|jgi:LacI family transcriptional regulator